MHKLSGVWTHQGVACGDFHNSANFPVNKEDPQREEMRKLPRKPHGKLKRLSDLQGDEGPHAASDSNAPSEYPKCVHLLAYDAGSIFRHGVN